MVNALAASLAIIAKSIGESIEEVAENTENAAQKEEATTKFTRENVPYKLTIYGEPETIDNYVDHRSHPKKVVHDRTKQPANVCPGATSVKIDTGEYQVAQKEDFEGRRTTYFTPQIDVRGKGISSLGITGCKKLTTHSGELGQGKPTKTFLRGDYKNLSNQDWNAQIQGVDGCVKKVVCEWDDLTPAKLRELYDNTDVRRELVYNDARDMVCAYGFNADGDIGGGNTCVTFEDQQAGYKEFCSKNKNIKTNETCKNDFKQFALSAYREAARTYCDNNSSDEWCSCLAVTDNTNWCSDSSRAGCSKYTSEMAKNVEELKKVGVFGNDVTINDMSKRLLKGGTLCTGSTDRFIPFDLPLEAVNICASKVAVGGNSMADIKSACSITTNNESSTTVNTNGNGGGSPATTPTRTRSPTPTPTLTPAPEEDNTNTYLAIGGGASSSLMMVAALVAVIALK